MIDAAVAVPLAGKFLAPDSTDTWVLVAFLMFIGLLMYLGVPGMIGKMLDDRAETIRGQLNEARKLREEAQRKLAEFERKHAEVERQADEIVARAKQEAESAAEDAKRSIEALGRAAVEIGRGADRHGGSRRGARSARHRRDAAVTAARKVLGETIGAQDHTTLIDAAIQETASRAN